MYYSAQELFFSVSMAVYVASSVFVGSVRWGHKCKPYSKHKDYYYPGWRVIVQCALTNLLLIPVIIFPQEADSVLQFRMALILSSPFFCASIIFSYFGKVLGVTWWKKPIHSLSIPFSILFISGAVFSIMPGRQLQGTFMRAYFATTGTMSLVFLGIFLMALRMIYRALKRQSEENYSNPEDFPHRFASRIRWIPIVYVSMSWVFTYIGTYFCLSICALLLSVLNIAFLINALSPHRAMDIKQLDKDQQAAEKVPAPKEDAQKEDILRTIRHCVEDEKAYLDSHLTLTTLSRSCGVNRTYISQVMNERLGGFFTYVNSCRLDYAAEFKNQHPEASVEDIATSSGFGSRQTYYNVRRQLEKTLES